MPLKVTCDHCQKTLKAPDKLAGKRVRCPSCQTTIQIPDPDAGWEEFMESATSDEPIADKVNPKRKADQPVSKSTKQGSDSEAEFDWSRPMEPAAEQPIEEAFDDMEQLPSLAPAPRRKVRTGSPSQTEPDVAFVGQLGDEGPSMANRRKDTSRRLRKDDDRNMSSSASLGYWHWLLLLALIPLAISIFLPSKPFAEQLEEVLAQNPELAKNIEQFESKDDFLAALPDGKLPGALLSRSTQMHWGFAVIASAVLLPLILVMFPGSSVGPGRLLFFGVLTGTVGILLLLGFQWVAELSQGIRIRGRGIGVLIFLIIKFIGFSYRCATDGESGVILSFMGFTCGVGLCEELCKALPVAFYLSSLTAKEMNWKSACLVGLASGIGFGVSEGIMYSSDYYNGIAPGLTYVVRFASCVTLHAVWASSVSLLMFNNQEHLPVTSNDFGWDSIFWFVVVYLGIAMVLHGLYDTLLKQEMDIAALVIAVASFGWWSWLLSRQEAEVA